MRSGLLHSLLVTRVFKRQFARVHDVRVGFARRGKGEGEGRGLGSWEEEVEAAGTKMVEKNVFSHPLALHSTRPLTGFLRTGYCESPRADLGNHSVAGIVTTEFLDFSASRGNDLRQAGLTDGCKWCLCVARWKEAFDARTGDGDRKVPRVVLEATNRRALEGVGLEELRGFAVDGGSEGEKK